MNELVPVDLHRLGEGTPARRWERLGAALDRGGTGRRS